MNITAELVRELIAAQHPDLAELAVEPFDEGWDNVVFSLGDRWLVRLPRREASAPLVEKELAWLPVLAPRLALPVPVPFRGGTPGAGYPWSWSVVPRYDGTTADREAFGGSQTLVLARFLRSLHVEAPADAPKNPYRGIPLIERTDVPARLEKVLPLVGTESDTVLRLWNRAVEAPVAEANVWIHGDLHPRNLLVRDGRLTAVLDWGDMAAGDPATDLACAWMVFDSWSAIDALLDTYDAPPALVRRSVGWAIVFATVFVDGGLPEPYPKLGRELFKAVVRYGGGT